MGAHILALLNVSFTLMPSSNLQRALFSLFFALIVALAEGVLFVLWNSRRTMPKGDRSRLHRNPRARGVDVKVKVE